LSLPSIFFGHCRPLTHQGDNRSGTSPRCADHGRRSQLSGDGIRLQIDLPGEGWTVVHCETLHIAGHNAFAVNFIRLDEDTRSRIGRAIDRQSDRPAEDDETAIDGEANDD
jgi:hypothetical protein